MNTIALSPLPRRLAQLGLLLLGAVFLAGTGLWSTMAIYYSNLPAAWLRPHLS